MLKDFLFIVLVAITLSGCKIRKDIPMEQKVDTTLDYGQIVAKHKASAPNFQTLSANISVSYDNGKVEQSLPLSLRIKKGETILISAPLGIAKALLTEQKVQFYNKMDSTFFDGDYTFVEQLLGARLNYQMIENLLLGQLLLEAQEYAVIPTTEGYQCTANNIAPYELTSLINSHFRVGEAELLSSEQDLQVQIRYTYQRVGEDLFPNKLTLTTSSSKNRISLEVIFEQLQINPQLNFPFRIPSGYNPLTLSQ